MLNLQSFYRIRIITPSRFVVHSKAYPDQISRHRWRRIQTGCTGILTSVSHKIIHTQNITVEDFALPVCRKRRAETFCNTAVHIPFHIGKPLLQKGSYPSYCKCSPQLLFWKNPEHTEIFHVQTVFPAREGSSPDARGKG